jgi:hypothetical protein
MVKDMDSPSKWDWNQQPGGSWLTVNV